MQARSNLLLDGLFRKENSALLLLILFSILIPITVFLSCQGDAELRVSPTRINFGQTSMVRNFSIKNDGNDRGIFTSGVKSLNYNIRANANWISVNPSSGSCEKGDSHDIAVTINRSGMSSGAHNGSITVISNAGDATVSITMEVLPITSCNVNPTSLNFGNVTVGNSTSRTFEIRNTGETTLIGSVGENCQHFSITSGIGYYSLDPSEAREVTVRFSPSSDGTKTCTIETGDPACGDVYCTGAGIPDNPAPSAPTLISPANGSTINDPSPYLDWSNVTGADNYQVQVDDYSSFSTPVREHQTTSSGWTVTPDLSNDTYYWRVRAHNGAGWGQWSDIWSFTISSESPPPPPTLISPANGSTINDPSPYLDWSNVTGADNYQVQVDDYSSFSTPVRDHQTTSSGWTVTPDLSNDTYYWRVRAHNGAGWGQWSDTWSFTISTESPPPPPNPLSPSNGSTVCNPMPTLDWSDVQGADYYQVQVDNNSDFSSPERTQQRSSSQWMVSPDLPEDRWYWRVRAHNNMGWGDWSIPWNFWVMLLRPSPNLVTPANGTTIDDPSPVLQWTNDSQGDLFRVQVDNDPGFSTPSREHETTSYYWQVTPDLNDGIWYWRVQTHNYCGWGDWSDTWSFTIETPQPVWIEFTFSPPNYIFHTGNYPSQHNDIVATSYRCSLEHPSFCSCPHGTAEVDCHFNPIWPGLDAILQIYEENYNGIYVHSSTDSIRICISGDMADSDHGGGEVTFGSCVYPYWWHLEICSDDCFKFYRTSCGTGPFYFLELRDNPNLTHDDRIAVKKIRIDFLGWYGNYGITHSQGEIREAAPED